jgi:hypothetical protein
MPWDGKEWKPKTTISWEDGTELVKFYGDANHLTMAGLIGGAPLDDRIKTISDVNRERAILAITNKTK